MIIKHVNFWSENWTAKVVTRCYERNDGKRSRQRNEPWRGRCELWHSERHSFWKRWEI